ncbi:MAG: DUF6159 family protein [Actinomycetota bacterium]|nr:DUF6159 family protein [Actinomycetota bacterium]
MKTDRELVVLPVISFACMAVVGAVLFGAAWVIGLPGQNQSLSPGQYFILAVFYFLATFIAVFFNAAIVGAATIRLQGGNPTIGDGLRLAWSHVGKIVAWAALTASVGLVLRSLEERAGLLGRIVIGIIGAAWSAITFFVVPVLLYEPLGTIDSVKRSASLFKQRWGEQFTGNFSIGIVMFLAMIPIVLVAALLGAAVPVLGIAVGVIGVGLLVAVGSALTGVFNAALYRYATTGEASGPFTPDDLHGAFRPKRRGLLSGGA